MTEDKKRIAIATLCGLNATKEQVGGVFCYRNKEGHMIAALPDYFRDLNAMHKALMSQSKQFRLSFEAIMDNYCAGTGLLWCELGAKDYADIFLQINTK